MIILGIETSCDETAAAVVTGDKRILSNIVLSQWEEHRPYGGVVPEIAARAHIQHIDHIITEALTRAGVGLSELDAIAATGGPGLIGGVIVGVMTGKALASVHRKPFIAVNHLEGHALTARLTDDVEFPFLLLLVSGGHCQLLIVKGVGNYEKLGSTMDDALGEAFDKTAKMIGLPYPGGPQVEKLALLGNPTRFDFPRPLLGREGCDFSFSGLKTAVRREVLALREARPGGRASHEPPKAHPMEFSGENSGGNSINLQDKADLCASFQAAAGEVVEDRTRAAIGRFRQVCPEGKTLVVAGGVAANQYLRGILTRLAQEANLRFVAPPMALCTDNAAMIAWAGLERFRLGQQDALDFEPRARWPL